MSENLLAVENMYDFRRKLMIIGLTGRTGSGCTTVADILNKDEIDQLDLKKPKTYDFLNSDERKYQVIFNYMEKGEHWKSFISIEGSCIILSFIFEKGYKEFIDYLEYIDSSEICKIDNLSYLKNELAILSDAFSEIKEFSLEDDLVENENTRIAEYFNFYIKTIVDYKKIMQGILCKHICYLKSTNGEKAQLYTYLMQTWGNNIRSSGNPYVENFTQKNYYDIAKRIDIIIKIICKYQQTKSQDESNYPVRICIDALRNPYEAIYFKDNYEMFRLFAITTEDEFRISRLSHLGKQERDTIDKTENSSKFVKTEEQFFHQNIQACVEISDIHIYNPDVPDGKYYFLSEQLFKYVALMSHPGLVTPTHIERCMQLAYNAKFNSGCLSRQVGAVITGDDYSVRAVGWNDVPKGQVPCNLRDIEAYCKNKDFETFSEYERCDPQFDISMSKIQKEVRVKKLGGRLFSYCFKDVHNGIKKKDNQVFTRSLHAEENAFLQITKYGGVGIQGGFLFTTASPCELCAKKAYQLGISNIYYIDPYPGISMKHILKFGKNGNPKMNMFFGAIGNAYISLYAQRMSIKDELELVSGINCEKFLREADVSKNEEILESNIEYKYIDLSLKYQDKINITSEKKVCLGVVGTPINHLSKTIFWTGSKYIQTRLESDDKSFGFEDSNREKPPHRYNVIFNRNIMQGEKVEFSLVTDVSDEDEEMQPFLSHTIKNKTDKLILTVCFIKGKVKNVKYQIYRDSDRELPCGKPNALSGIDEGEYIKYMQIVDNPQLLFSYCIEWEFEEIKL